MKRKQVSRKSGWAVLAILATLSILSCHSDPFSSGVDNTFYSAEEPFSFTVNITNENMLELSAINGTVEILGGAETQTVHIWGVRRVESESEEDARQYLQNVAVEIAGIGDRILVETDQPDDTEGRNVLVEYHLRVPRTWTVIAGQANGEMEIRDMLGTVDANLSNGELTIDNIGGPVDADLSNGNMHLINIAASVDADLSNGNVDASVYLPLNGTCAINATNGQILAAFPQTTSAAFSAGVTNGIIAVSGLTLQNSQQTNKSLSGTLGSGQGVIHLETVNGNITVNGF